MKSKTPHSHGSLVGIVGIALGIVLMTVFPRFKAVGGVVVLFALFHLVGLVVVLGSAAALFPRRIARWTEQRRKRAGADKGYDFGWSVGPYIAPWVAGLIFLSAALGLQLQYPAYWPAWFLTALLGCNFFIGGLILQASKRLDYASVPLADFLSSDHDLVLDVGCGGGRTTLALSKVLKNGRVVCFDRFDAYYIDGGGRALLERNVRIAGIADRVQIEQGDVVHMPFEEAHFDSAISAHAIDHLQDKKAGLAEIRRVLKPGGRFLMVVATPGFATFTLANVLCFMLTNKAGWRKLAQEVGFTIHDEGIFNGMWFAVLERPR